MKNILFIGALSLLTLSSCKKDRTCACTVMGSDAGKTTYKKVTKGQAKANCYDYTLKQKNFEMAVECKLE